VGVVTAAELLTLRDVAGELAFTLTELSLRAFHDAEPLEIAGLELAESWYPGDGVQSAEAPASAVIVAQAREAAARWRVLLDAMRPIHDGDEADGN
jgi:hypothetical protein